MKRTISRILLVALVLGMMVFPVSAANSAIDFLVESGCWTEATNSDSAVTRAQTAAVLARFTDDSTVSYDGKYADVDENHAYAKDIMSATNLGIIQGSGGYFRPDDLVTKEEFTTMLVRAYEANGYSFYDRSYPETLMKDYENVSTWAQDYVIKGMSNEVIKGDKFKDFSPARSVSLKELAEAVYNMQYYFNDEKVGYTVRDVKSSDKITKDFDVLQSGMAHLQGCVVGYGMLAKFDKAPGEIYMARTTASTNSIGGLHGDPRVICKVIGPDGYTVCRVNLYYKEDGTMEKIVNIPEGQPGIYRIQFVGGREGDVFTVGVKSPKSWGVFGEPEFTFTETTPKTSYFWVPEKYDTICLGVAQKGATASVFEKDGTTALYTTSESTGYGLGGHSGNVEAGRVNMKDLESGEVYRLEVADDFRGRFSIVGGSCLISPTAEMAADLKGGFVYYEDEYVSLQTFGPLQAKARARMTEIYKEAGGEEGFFVDTDIVPENVPENLDNPIAEAILFSNFNGSLQSIKNTCENQVLDPESPLMGMYMGAYLRGEREWPTKWWEYSTINPADGESERGWLGKANLTGALTLNAETNYWYNNDALRRRVELQYLAWALTMNPGGALYGRQPDDSALVHYWTQTQFYLGEHNMPSGYYQVRNFLSPETRKITDQAISEIIEHMMHSSGQGNTNQYLLSAEAALYAALSFPEYDHYLDYVNSCVDGVVHPTNIPDVTGQAPLGYWMESGCDGSSYGRMNEGLWYTIVMSYLHELPVERQDAYTVSKLIEATERNLDFDAVFYAPTVGPFYDTHSSAYTSREEGSYGNNPTIIGNHYLINQFPKAKATHLAGAVETFDPATYEVHGERQNQLVNDIQAKGYLEASWSRWGKPYRDAYIDSYQSATTRLLYMTRHMPQAFDESEVPTLPYAVQDDYYVFEAGEGLMGVKHKGMYYQFFYSNGLDIISPYSWHTAAPMEIWDEYFSTVAVSQKPHSGTWRNIPDGGFPPYDYAPNDYRPAFKLDNIVTSGVVGTLANGDIMIEGKEYHNELTWLEPGKKFKISGQNCYGGKKVVWIYTMTEEGMEIEGGVESIEEGDDLWIQIPFIDRSSEVPGATLTYSDDKNNVVTAYSGKSVTFGWEEGTESRFLAKRGENSIYRELQLKLTPEKPLAKIKITRDVGDYKLAIYDTAGV